MHKTTNPDAIFGRLALFGVRDIVSKRKNILSAKEFMASFDASEATDQEDSSVEDELDKEGDETFHFFENNLEFWPWDFVAGDKGKVPDFWRGNDKDITQTKPV